MLDPYACLFKTYKLVPEEKELLKMYIAPVT